MFLVLGPEADWEGPVRVICAVISKFPVIVASIRVIDVIYGER